MVATTPEANSSTHRAWSSTLILKRSGWKALPLAYIRSGVSPSKCMIKSASWTTRSWKMHPPSFRNSSDGTGWSRNTAWTARGSPISPARTALSSPT